MCMRPKLHWGLVHASELRWAKGQWCVCFKKQCWCLNPSALHCLQFTFFFFTEHFWNVASGLCNRVLSTMVAMTPPPGVQTQKAHTQVRERTWRNSLQPQSTDRGCKALQAPVQKKQKYNNNKCSFFFPKMSAFVFSIKENLVFNYIKLTFWNWKFWIKLYWYMTSFISLNIHI